jgi:hypothetical protein
MPTQPVFNNISTGFLSQKNMLNLALVTNEGLSVGDVGKYLSEARRTDLKLDNENISVDQIMSRFTDAHARIFKNRPTRSTILNPTSSRSHLFIMVRFYVKTQEGIVDPTPVVLTICDMAGNERTHSFLAEAKQESLFIYETLKRAKNFSFYLRNYANSKPILFYGSNNEPAMYSPAAPDKISGEGNTGTYYIYPKTLFLKSGAFSVTTQTRLIYNLLKFMIGFSNERQLKQYGQHSIALTKLLTFANIPGYLKRTNVLGAEVENRRRCIDSLISLDFAFYLTGLDPDNVKRRRGFRWNNDFGYHRRQQQVYQRQRQARQRKYNSRRMSYY